MLIIIRYHFNLQFTNLEVEHERLRKSITDKNTTLDDDW